jgi:prepilin-type N-terminal cleavage/methylation domain-containing protein
MFSVVLKGRRGFTMIELLVVISIIGLLTTILYANFSQGKMQARDKIRKAELKELQLAIELYKAQKSVYPTTLEDLTPDFIAEVPDDPGGGSYSYSSFDGGTSYKVRNDNVESQYVTSFSDEFARCPAISANCPSVEAIQATYAVYSAGAEDE